MRPWASALTAVAIVSAVPLFATMLLAWNTTAVRRVLPMLVAFGVGALAGTASMHLVPHALEQQPAALVGMITLAGFAAFGLVERLLGAHDHAHAHGLPMGGPATPPGALAVGVGAGTVHAHAAGGADVAHDHHAHAILPLNFVADAVHNLVDGVLIASAFLVDPTVGLVTMFAVAIHEVPRELGTFAVFVHGGVSPKRAVLFNAVTGLVALAGASLALVIGPQIGDAARFILPFAAGTYFFIAWAVGRSVFTRGGETARTWRLASAVAGFVATAIGASSF